MAADANNLAPDWQIQHFCAAAGPFPSHNLTAGTATASGIMIVLAVSVVPAGCAAQRRRNLE